MARVYLRAAQGREIIQAAWYPCARAPRIVWLYTVNVDAVGSIVVEKVEMDKRCVVFNDADDDDRIGCGYVQGLVELVCQQMALDDSLIGIVLVRAHNIKGR